MPGILKLGVERLLLPRLMNGLDKYKACSKTLAEACMQDRFAPSTGSQNVIQFLFNEEVGGEKADDEEFSTAELISETSLLIIAGKWTLYGLKSTT